MKDSIVWKKREMDKGKVFSGILNITPDNLFGLVNDFINNYWPDLPGAGEYSYKDFRAEWDEQNHINTIFANKVHNTGEEILETNLTPVSVIEILAQSLTPATSYVEVYYSYGQEELASSVSSYLQSRLVERIPYPDELSIYEIMPKGELIHFQGMMEQLKINPLRHRLGIYGPIVQGTTLTWFISNGDNKILDAIKHGRPEGMGIGMGGQYIKLWGGMTLEELVFVAENQKTDLPHLIRVGLVTVAELPQGQIRILLSHGGIEPPIVFWFWAVELMKEMERLGFSEIQPMEDGESLNQQKQDEQLEPWKKIPDHLWDRVAVEMWCNGYTNRDIANKVSVQPRVVTNRISQLRQLYPSIPTNDQRRKLMIKGDTG